MGRKTRIALAACALVLGLNYGSDWLKTVYNDLSSRAGTTLGPFRYLPGYMFDTTQYAIGYLAEGRHIIDSFAKAGDDARNGRRQSSGEE